MIIADVATVVLLAGGAYFFFAGTMGVLRFPDALARLHAVTKADNLGFGMIVFGLALQAETVLAALKLLLIWTMVLVASATSGFLIASCAARSETESERPS